MKAKTVYAFCIITALLLSNFKVENQLLLKKGVRDIKMYIVPIGSFVRYSIDSVNIKSNYTYKLNISNPNRFLKRLRNNLQNKREGGIDSFGFKQVRVLYAVRYEDGKHENIIVDITRSVFWRGEVYSTDPNSLRFMLSPLNRNQKMKCM